MNLLKPNLVTIVIAIVRMLAFLIEFEVIFI